MQLYRNNCIRDLTVEPAAFMAMQQGAKVSAGALCGAVLVDFGQHYLAGLL
jgi:hypothetical protein